MSEGTLTTVVGERVYKLIGDYCWEHRISRSKLLKKIVEEWISEQQGKGELLDEYPADGTLVRDATSSP